MFTFVLGYGQRVGSEDTSLCEGDTSFRSQGYSLFSHPWNATPETWGTVLREFVGRWKGLRVGLNCSTQTGSKCVNRVQLAPSAALC